MKNLALIGWNPQAEQTMVHTHGYWLFMAAFMFAWLHMPTVIHKELPDLATQAQTRNLGKYEHLLRSAEETLNGGLTPVLGLKQHPIVFRSDQ